MGEGWDDGTCKVEVKDAFLGKRGADKKQRHYSGVRVISGPAGGIGQIPFGQRWISVLCENLADNMILPRV